MDHRIDIAVLRDQAQRIDLLPASKALRRLRRVAVRIKLLLFLPFVPIVILIAAFVSVRTFFVLIRLGSFTEEDILGLPKGTAMLRLLKKLRWL